MKKGRHRRFEEARALKQSTDPLGIDLDLDDAPKAKAEPCPECGAAPGADHASWCMYTEVDEGEEGDTGAYGA